MKYKRIFVISFFKNASTSFHHYFKKVYKVQSKHGGRIKQWNQNLLTNKGKPFKQRCAYCFASIEFVKLNILSEYYPKDKYILPTRPFIDWIISIINWYKMEYIDLGWLLIYLNARNEGYQLVENVMNINPIDLIKINIKKDDVKKMTDDFLGYKNIERNFYHKNNTEKKQKPKAKNIKEIVDFVKKIFIELNIKMKHIQSDWLIRSKNEKIIFDMKDYSNQDKLKIVY